MAYELFTQSVLPTEREHPEQKTLEPIGAREQPRGVTVIPEGEPPSRSMTPEETGLWKRGRDGSYYRVRW